MFPRGKKYLCVQLWTSPYQQYTKWICCQKILLNTMNMLSDNYLIRKCVSHLLNSHLGPPYLSVQLQLNQPQVSIHVPPCKHGFVAQWSFAIREMALHCSGDLMKQLNQTKKFFLIKKKWFIWTRLRFHYTRTNSFHFENGVGIFPMLVNCPDSKFKYVVLVWRDAGNVSCGVVQSHALW